MSGRSRRRWGVGVMALFAGMLLAGCQEEELPLPTPEEVRDYYTSEYTMEAELSGNVAVLTVQQSPEQLRRGGRLWAMVGPYIFLFSDASYQLLEEWPGLAGIRVVTRVGSNGPWVARALLAREDMSGVLWRRSLNISGKARRDGTEKVTLLQDLVDWGEEHTEHEYNPRYTARR